MKDLGDNSYPQAAKQLKKTKQETTTESFSKEW